MDKIIYYKYYRLKCLYIGDFLNRFKKDNVKDHEPEFVLNLDLSLLKETYELDNNRLLII